MSSHSLNSLGTPTPEFWRHLAQRAHWEVPLAAQQLGISLRKLERLCQGHLGCTPRDWLHRERIAEAAELLTAGHPVKVVAAQLGYTLLANFSRDFKLHFAKRPTSVTPSPFTRLPLGPNVPGQDHAPK